MIYSLASKNSDMQEEEKDIALFIPLGSVATSGMLTTGGRSLVSASAWILASRARFCSCAARSDWRRLAIIAMLGCRLEPLESASSSCLTWSRLPRYSFCMVARSAWMSIAMLTASSLPGAAAAPAAHPPILTGRELAAAPCCAGGSRPDRLVGRPRLRLARLGLEVESAAMEVRVDTSSPSPSTGLARSVVAARPDTVPPLDFFFRSFSSFFMAELDCSPPSASSLPSVSISCPSCVLILCTCPVSCSSCAAISASTAARPALAPPPAPPRSRELRWLEKVRLAGPSWDTGDTQSGSGAEAEQLVWCCT